MAVVASFSKVWVFSGNDPSTRQQYHYNNIVFKSFHFGDHFRQLPFSAKTVIVFDRFVQMQNDNAKKFAVSMETI